MRMTRIFYSDNPAKFTEFLEVSEGQIINAFAKLRRIGYTDQDFITCCKLLISKVPELEDDAVSKRPYTPEERKYIDEQLQEED